MNFGFLDFTTLEKRKFYCEEEVRLNRRLAPDIYLDTVAIYGSAASPTFVADGHPPIEYAVRMRQFDPTSVLTHTQHPRQDLSRLLIQVMVSVARFHETGCAIATLDQPSALPTLFWRQWPRISNRFARSFKTPMTLPAGADTQLVAQ